MPRSSQPPRGPQANAIRGDAILLLDDWADFYAEQPQDLVFECLAGSGEAVSGVTVFTDRISLATNGGVEPVVLDLDRVEAWSVLPDRNSPEDVEVQIVALSTVTARVPAAFAGMVTIALTDALGPPRTR